MESERYKLFREFEQAVINGMLQAWQFHLQNMVIAPDPIKYLGDNI